MYHPSNNQIIEAKQKLKNTSCPCRPYNLMLPEGGSWWVLFSHLEKPELLNTIFFPGMNSGIFLYIV